VIVEAFWPVPIPAPAEIESAPVDPFKLLTTLAEARVEAEIVREPAPAPTLMIPPPEITRAFENVPVDETVVFPLALILREEVCTLAEMVMVEALAAIPTPAPAWSVTLLLDPFKLKLVAAGIVGPMIWMEDAPVLIVTFDPESTIVPVEVARLEPWMTFPPPPEGDGPTIVIEEAFELRVMFAPATRLTDCPEPFRLNCWEERDEMEALA